MRRRRAVEYSSCGTDSRAETVWSAGSTCRSTRTSLLCSAAARPDEDLAQGVDVGLEQLLLGQDLEEGHQGGLVVAALDDVLQLQDPPQLEPQHRRDDRRLGRRLAAEHAHHPEGAGRPRRRDRRRRRRCGAWGPGGGPCSPRPSARCAPAARSPGAASGGSGRRAERGVRLGEDAEGVDDPASRRRRQQPSRTKLSSSSHSRRSAPSATSSGGKRRAAWRRSRAAARATSRAHGQEVAGGGEDVGQDRPDGGHQRPAGLGGDPGAQLHLEERLPVGGVPGGQDRRQPARRPSARSRRQGEAHASPCAPAGAAPPSPW